MQIVVTREAAQTTLALNGRLDTSTSRQLEDRLNEVFKQGFEKLVLDLAGIQYISSTGLRIIMAAQKLCKARGTGLAVKNVSATVAEAFEISGFSSFLTFG